MIISRVSALFNCKNVLYSTSRVRYLSDDSELKRIISKIITYVGPIPLSTYIGMCLNHPEYGYYTKGGKIGPAGKDFITSPEISSLFTECIGDWADKQLKQLKPFNLRQLSIIELGPGNGSMMRSIINAFPSKSYDIDIYMVELSKQLAKIQFEKLCVPDSLVEVDSKSGLPYYMKGKTYCGKSIQWFTNTSELSRIKGLKFYVGNEFLDALPPKQFVKKNNNWHEVCVDLDNNKKNFKMAISKTPYNLPFMVKNTAYSDLLEKRNWLEFSIEALYIWESILKDIKEHNGLALVIDYGYTTIDIPDAPSLRGFYKHSVNDIFEHIGFSDITYDIDFSILQTFKTESISISQPITQRDFLLEQNIHGKGELLKNGLNSNQKAIIDSSIDFLINPSKMGVRFKLICAKSELFN